MNVSMNGLRSNLSYDVERLKSLVLDVINDNYYEDDDLIEAMNQVITDSNVLNCVFLNDDESFNDMSHVEVEHLEASE